MLPVEKDEMHHRGQYWSENTQNSGCGRYLAVKMFADNQHVKGVHPSPFIGIHLQENRVSVEHELRVGELEVLCCAHKLREGRDRRNMCRLGMTIWSLSRRGVVIRGRSASK